MNKLNTVLLCSVAAQAASIGFQSGIVLMSQIVPPDISADTSLTTSIDVNKAVIPVSFGGMTKFLAVTDVSGDGKAATFSMLGSQDAVYEYLQSSGDYELPGEPITLDQLKAGGIDGAKELLEFKIAQAA